MLALGPKISSQQNLPEGEPPTLSDLWFPGSPGQFLRSQPHEDPKVDSADPKTQLPYNHHKATEPHRSPCPTCWEALPGKTGRGNQESERWSISSKIEHLGRKSVKINQEDEIFWVVKRNWAFYFPLATQLSIYKRDQLIEKWKKLCFLLTSDLYCKWICDSRTLEGWSLEFREW